MSKEIAKKETAALSTSVNSNAWGSEGIDASDVVIPKLLLMQGLSEFVAAGEAKSGDIARSTTGEVLGGVNKGVEIIPFMTFKTWKLEENTGSKFEYRGVEPITAENANEPLEWNVNGKHWRRNRCLNFYVLLPVDIAKEAAAMKKLETSGDLPDPGDALLPCVLTFQRTSYGAGKDLATHFMKAAHFGVPPAVSKFKLTSKLEKNEKGTFSIFEVEASGKSTTEEIAACKKWYETISQTKVKVVVDDPEAKTKPEKKVQDKATPKASKDSFEAEIENVF